MRSRRLLAALALVAALAACTSPPTTADPCSRRPPRTSRTTRLGLTSSRRRTRARRSPSSPTAVAGIRRPGVSVEAGVVCLSWSWGGEGCRRWPTGCRSPSPTPCSSRPPGPSTPPRAPGQSGRACLGAIVTVRRLRLPRRFARDAGPTPATAPTRSSACPGTLTARSRRPDRLRRDGRAAQHRPGRLRRPRPRVLPGHQRRRLAAGPTRAAASRAGTRA